MLSSLLLALSSPFLLLFVYLVFSPLLTLHLSHRPYPIPLPLIGSLWEYYFSGIENTHAKWIAKFGEVFKLQFGGHVGTMIANPIILKEILVSKFESFRNRNLVFASDDLISRHSLPLVKDEKWRRLRITMLLTFTAFKLKAMIPCIEECAQRLTQNIVVECEKNNKASSPNFEAKSIFGYFAMDAIASTAFGLNIDSYMDKDNAFIHNAKKCLGGSFFSFKILLLLMFPFLSKFMTLNALDESALNFFVDIVKKTIALRDEDLDDRNDFLSLLLKASRHKDGENIHKTIENEEGEVLDTSTLPKMSEEEVLANSCLFILAAYETTSTALALTVYMLTQFPNWQEEIYEEIQPIASHERIHFEDLKNLHKLDAFIKETLRYLPPTLQVDRVANADLELHDTEISIRKGDVILIPITYINKHPDLWTCPDDFKPERFFEESCETSMGFFTFGFGPRKCIGLRLALLEMKIALVKMISSIRFIKTQNLPNYSELSNEPKNKSFANYPDNGLRIGIELRCK